jgi:ankyrin repeat protein
MCIPLLNGGRVDTAALGAQVDWTDLSAFESLILTFEHANWAGLLKEVKGTPSLARLTWNDGENLLSTAAHDGQLELVNLLIDFGADVNSKGRFETPIYSAVWSGNPEIVGLLIKNGANVNAKCEHGRTPLHLAAAKGYADIVQQLLDANADVDSTDDSSYTALDEAAQMQHPEVTRLLIARSAKYSSSTTQAYIDSLRVGQEDDGAAEEAPGGRR